MWSQHFSMSTEYRNNNLPQKDIIVQTYKQDKNANVTGYEILMPAQIEK
jgi:hypothetical protein